MCQGYMKYLILLYRPVRSQSSIRGHQPLWPEAQTNDSVLGLVIQYVHKGDKPNCSAFLKIRFNAVWKYLLQFDQMVMKQGVLHQLNIFNDVESNQ